MKLKAEKNCLYILGSNVEFSLLLVKTHTASFNGPVRSCQVRDNKQERAALSTIAPQLLYQMLNHDCTFYHIRIQRHSEDQTSPIPRIRLSFRSISQYEKYETLPSVPIIWLQGIGYENVACRFLCPMIKNKHHKKSNPGNKVQHFLAKIKYNGVSAVFVTILSKVSYLLKTPSYIYHCDLKLFQTTQLCRKHQLFTILLLYFPYFLFSLYFVEH